MGRKRGPPTGDRSLRRRSHLILDVAAAAGDGVVGPTSEQGNGGRWTTKGDDDAAMATTETGSPDFSPASNHYLRFPLDLQNFCMKIVWIFLLFNAIFVSVGGRISVSWV